MLEHLSQKKILLGSKSPRRQELLGGLGISFEIVSIDCDESYPADLEKSAITEFISEKKAQAYLGLKAEEILITADTLVVLGDLILGKPKTEAQAFEMLKKLSGQAHQVYTSVSIRSIEKLLTISEVTTVFFDEISNDEIHYYIQNHSPLDKAGAYGIQDWLGFSKINRIEGCYYNVMGLPLRKLYRALEAI